MTIVSAALMTMPAVLTLSMRLLITAAHLKRSRRCWALRAWMATLRARLPTPRKRRSWTGIPSLAGAHWPQSTVAPFFTLHT